LSDPSDWTEGSELEYVFGEEEESDVGDDEKLAWWRGRDAHDDFPDYMIAWPLSSDHPLLKAEYSLGTNASKAKHKTPTYDQQILKLVETMEDVPINCTNRGKTKKARMAAYDSTTISTRTKHAGFFIGFCVNVLGLKANLEHTCDAQTVAKYWGWHKAKGTKVCGVHAHICGEE